MSGAQGDDSTPTVEEDSQLQTEMQRLYQIMLRGRWFVVTILWLTFGVASLWGLRSMLALAIEHFTWASIRYGLRYHPWSTLGLALCIAMTLSVLMWQSRNILFGLPKHQQQQLRQQVLRIRAQGQSHPFWRWVCLPDSKTTSSRP
jgi:hypothetical protein